MSKQQRLARKRHYQMLFLYRYRYNRALQRELGGHVLCHFLVSEFIAKNADASNPSNPGPSGRLEACHQTHVTSGP